MFFKIRNYIKKIEKPYERNINDSYKSLIKVVDNDSWYSVPMVAVFNRQMVLGVRVGLDFEHACVSIFKVFWKFGC